MDVVHHIKTDEVEDPIVDEAPADNLDVEMDE